MIDFYITFEDMPAAEAAARKALEARPAACASILTGPRSYLRRNGAIVAETEILMVPKTSSGEAGKSGRFIAENHPYDNPAIFLYDGGTANQSHLDWVAAETRTEQS